MLQGHQDGKSLVMRSFFAEAEWTLSTCATIVTDFCCCFNMKVSEVTPPTHKHSSQVHLFLLVLASILMTGNSLWQGISNF